MTAPPFLLGGLLIASLCAAVSVCAQTQAPELPSGWIPKKAISMRHDMVAGANPLAVAAGHDLLKQGGTVVDAAVASGADPRREGTVESD